MCDVNSLQVAYKLGKPILLPGWVMDCWNRTLSSAEVFHAAEEVMFVHNCNILHNCIEQSNRFP